MNWFESCQSENTDIRYFLIMGKSRNYSDSQVPDRTVMFAFSFPLKCSAPSVNLLRRKFSTDPSPPLNRPLRVWFLHLPHFRKLTWPANLAKILAQEYLMQHLENVKKYYIDDVWSGFSTIEDDYAQISVAHSAFSLDILSPLPASCMIWPA